MLTKKQNFLTAILCAFLFMRCEGNTPKYTIPFAPVYFTFDINGYDSSLRNGFSYKIFNESNRRFDTDRFGFSGVIVVSDDLGEKFFAYDLCCPHESKQDIIVDPEFDEKGYIGKVKCKKCGTVYLTSYGFGSVESGPGKNVLQHYNVQPFDNGTYRVFN